jgi:hypothetical protein
MCVILICWCRAILSKYKVRSRDQGLAPFQQTGGKEARKYSQKKRVIGIENPKKRPLNASHRGRGAKEGYQLDPPLQDTPESPGTPTPGPKQAPRASESPKEDSNESPDIQINLAEIRTTVIEVILPLT